MTKTENTPAIGLRRLAELSPHVSAVAAIGALAALAEPREIIATERCADAPILRPRAEIVLLSLPPADRLVAAELALRDVLTSPDATETEVEADLVEALALLQMPRSISRKALIEGAALAIRAPRAIVAATLRKAITSEKYMPSIGELIAEIEAQRREAVRLLSAVSHAGVARYAATDLLVGCCGAHDFCVQTGDLPADWDKLSDDENDPGF